MLADNRPVRPDSHTLLLRAHIIVVPFDPEHGVLEDCHNRQCWKYLANVAPKPLLLRVLCGEYVRPCPWPDTWANLAAAPCNSCLEVADLRRKMPPEFFAHQILVSEPGRAGNAEQE